MFIRRYKWPILCVVGAVISLGLLDHFVYHNVLWKKITQKTDASPLGLPSIALVDMARIHEESAPFKALNGFLESRYSQTEQHIFQKENELRQEHKELSEQEKMLEKPDEALAKKRQDFQQKVESLEKDVLEQKKQFNEQFQALNQKVEEKLQEIIRDRALAKGVTLVINRALGQDALIVLFAKDTFDMTSEITEHLDAIKDEFDIPTS